MVRAAKGPQHAVCSTTALPKPGCGVARAQPGPACSRSCWRCPKPCARRNRPAAPSVRPRRLQRGLLRRRASTKALHACQVCKRHRYSRSRARGGACSPVHAPASHVAAHAPRTLVPFGAKPSRCGKRARARAGGPAPVDMALGALAGSAAADVAALILRPDFNQLQARGARPAG